MKLKAAFIFLAPEADFTKDVTTICTPEVDLTTVGAKNYEDAVKAAKLLEGDGITAIELCAGFGIQGVAEIKQNISAEIPVGVVRFDYHPGLNHQSGDDLF
ncbi:MULTISPECIES: DUF6506 family protein [unclassified Enterococcus]|uniref:DUF6506 family protein n=1 Tax=unclassified Enterococcus TaxID=2608891 RepID=UPI0015553B37|nr:MULTISPECIES: DUF6506 family protein [unclassified Enterococcus]MBS7578341.1 hypothetical protein [Enterococcus sp. MMGLQ5-2]MBS7585578.1 hypothetical protein [Enterococcus sp. MMGLQ5-1]NPD13437.1 hypothetical protein [Enterococcus sp. MMGLQ5-1]NPD38172.1 hypothetical protein [Enterococcus sp. MMGLQ5-2]